MRKQLWLLVLFGNSNNTPHVFLVETTWKRPFPCRFKVEYTWRVCREMRSNERWAKYLKMCPFLLDDRDHVFSLKLRT